MSVIPEIQGSLFCLVLLIYLSTLLGNILTTLITEVDNLSFLEIGYTTSTIPKMLVNFLTKRKGISFLGCATQMYVLSLLGITECCLLAAMAFDHYVALCRPLAVSWLIGVLVALGQTTFIFTLPYCGPNRINHFFCDLPPLLKLASVDTCKNEITTYKLATVSLSYILMSPMMNPLIYSLRNREVKQALKRLIAKNINI
uniref:G-protein coupled receptors family 1 profile domain-containing protein n=1 Tax=Bubo bubo TaxID=30461 RepID=A0A8C0FSV9_BUBBB